MGARLGAMHYDPLVLAPRADVAHAAATFAANGRMQLQDLLTPQSAAEVQTILANRTPWEVAWQVGDGQPQVIRNQELAMADGQTRLQDVQRLATETAAAGQFAFVFARYPMLDAYLGRWNPGSPQDRLLEQINSPPFLDLMRAVTGIPGILKADAQATLYEPGHFLSRHHDSHVGQGWRVAYVMNFATDGWQADWGGDLEFSDDAGRVHTTWQPRFNTINLFAVPQPHAVTPVAAQARGKRLAITGWLRDR